MTLDLARLSALIDAATPGPWITHPGMREDTSDVLDDEDGFLMFEVGNANAAFIAAFDPTTAKALLSEIAGLRASLEHIERLASDWNNPTPSAGFAAIQTVAQKTLAATEPAEREAAPDLGSERGRLLAERDRLIAAGVDPADLTLLVAEREAE